MKKQLLISLSIILFLVIATVSVVLYGKGYQIFLDKGKPGISQTGMLVATSTPDSAQVFIDGHLTTATPNTLNLPPGEYKVEIKLEGYFPWEKKVKIQKEVVTKAQALLFPQAPKLESITANGTENPVIDPSFTKIAYTVASQSARKNGIYILDISSRPILTLKSASTQITDDTTDLFSTSNIRWSPDGKQLLATISETERGTTTYLLDASSLNTSPKDITATLSQVEFSWIQEKEEKENARFQALKSNLRKVISENFNILSWSPDETKILYQASTSATIPIIIKPSIIGTNSTPEHRYIEKDSVYIYDMKEDKNYKLNVPSCQSNNKCPLSWFPDSNHLIYVHDKKIDIIEYDSTNQTTIYAGPFIDNYVFPWTNGSRIIILTNLGNPSITPNLYTIGLK